MSDAELVLDVSELPQSAFGPRTPVWWGTVVLIAIELTTFVLLLVSYLYTRGNFGAFPPSWPVPLGPMAVQAATLGISLVPAALAYRAARAEKLRAARIWVVVLLIVSVLCAAVRWWELAALPFSWRTNAYTSAVWVIFGTHAFELAIGIGENLLLAVVLFRPTLEKKILTDVETTTLFWFFIVLVWLPMALLFALEGGAR